jgi:hypothetical protein
MGKKKKREKKRKWQASQKRKNAYSYKTNN